jgi:predicted ribosome quality control (RQC) complex YloA/Tae2 family protein
MDTFVLNAIVQELQQPLCPSRLQHIWQPDEFSVTLEFWQRGEERRLAISVAPQHQYLFLTDAAPDKTPLAFGKFLQHHLKGGELRTLVKPPLERILTFEIVKKDIAGQTIPYQLILEIMGRHSNLILVNQATQKILESIHHVTASQTSYRRIAPGAVYVPPPPQKKTDLLTFDREQFQELLQAYQEGRSQGQKLPLWKFLLQHVRGLSPFAARQIAGRPEDDDNEARWQRFSEVIEIVKTGRYQPTVVLAPDAPDDQPEPAALSAIPVHDQPSLVMDSMNQAAAWYYRVLVERQEYAALKAALLRPLNTRLKKLHKQREHLHDQQQQNDNMEQYKRWGELITTNIYQLEKGMRTAEVIDYYTAGQPRIEIALDPRLTPAQNAQRYFKRYNKCKHGQEVTRQRLQETEAEIAALEEQQFFIEDTQTLQQLRALRADLSVAPETETSRRSAKQAQTQPEEARPFWRFVSSDGFDIYVGRSSKENDALTQRTARPDDIWLHVQRAPGAHVLILNRQRNTPAPERTLTEAASLAAYYSKRRRDGRVEVVYTPKKFVKKPKGSPPGLVTLTQYQTLRVTPRATLEEAKK